MTRFAFEDLGLTRLKAGRAYDNPASGRVLAKLGFTPRHGSAFFAPKRRENRAAPLHAHFFRAWTHGSL